MWYEEYCNLLLYKATPVHQLLAHSGMRDSCCLYETAPICEQEQACRMFFKHRRTVQMLWSYYNLCTTWIVNVLLYKMWVVNMLPEQCSGHIM